MENQRDLFSGFLENSSLARTRMTKGDVKLLVRKKNGVGYLAFRKHFRNSVDEAIESIAIKFAPDRILMVLNPPEDLNIPSFKVHKSGLIQNQVLVKAFADHFNLGVPDGLLLSAEENHDTILGVRLFVLSKYIG